jgi:condensin complex subunit 3
MPLRKLQFLDRKLTSSEVRRAALYNLPRTKATFPHILTRTRDIDPILRRTVYHGSLGAASLPDARVLTIAQREKVVQYGLGDREMSVRKAAATMLGGWVDQAGGDLVEVGIPFGPWSSADDSF